MHNYMKLKGSVQPFSDVNGLSTAVEALDVAELRDIGIRNPAKLWLPQEKWKGVWNVSQDKPECIVSEDYTLLLHRQAFRQVVEAVKTLKTPVKGVVINNNGRAYVEVRFPEVQVDVEGDKIDLQIMFANSYDKSRAFRGMAGGFRLVCSNGMVVGKHICPELYSTHYGKTPEGMIEEVKKFIQAAMSSHGKLSELMSSAMEDQVGMKVAERLMQGFMTIEKHRLNLVDKLKELDREPTRWDIYNVITDYLTHNMEAKYEYVLSMHQTFANKFLTKDSGKLEKEAEALIVEREEKTEA